MRRSSVAIAAVLITILTIGWLWSRNRDEGGSAPVIQQPDPTVDRGTIRGTPETDRGWEELKARATASSYGYDVWREPSCGGVALFYLPNAEDEDVAWYLFDLQSEQITEQTTLTEVVQALAPHLDGFQQFTPNYTIGQLSTPEGRPLYSIGRVASGGTVQIGFSPKHCSAVPNRVQVMTWNGPSPVDIDLPKAIEQIRQQNRSSAQQ